MTDRAAWLPVAAVATAVLLATPSSAVGARPVGGEWGLDRAAGGRVVVDASGSGNNGTIHGRVVLGRPGHRGTSASFAADGSWVKVPSSGSLNPRRRDFRYSAWVNLRRTPRRGVTYDILRKGLTTTRGGEYKLEIIPGGFVKCTAKDEAHHKVALAYRGVKVTDGTWHKIGCGRVAATWRLRVDDVLRSTTVQLGRIRNRKSLSIGSKYGAEDGTPGRVDQVRVTMR